MSLRVWSYAALAFGTALVAAIMSAMHAGWPMVFATILLICLLFGLLNEAFLQSERLAATPRSDPASSLRAGFGRALLQQLPSALLVIDRKGKVAYANPAAFAMLPRLRPGDHFASLFRAPSFVEAVNETIAGGAVRRVEFSAGLSPDRHYSMQVGPVPQGSDLGEDVQAIIEIEDRTELHRVETMRTDFIANASHELRTPLTSIIGYVETLQGHARDDAEARERFLDIIARQARRMQRLVEDLTSLNRIEMNEHSRPAEECDINRLAQDSVIAMMPMAQKYSVALQTGDLGQPALVPGDRDQLNQVLANLIENAMKYSGPGETVTVAAAGPSEKFPRMAGISVSDTGPGIPREHLHRLTERFYRVNVAKSHEKGGTGLGLAIVKHILNRHDGELEIESQTGLGSRFTFWLPLAGQGAKPAEPSSAEN